MKIQVCISLYFSISVKAIQEFIREAKDTSVNSGDDILLPCLVRNKAGECRWENDGTPVGIYQDNQVCVGGDS